MSSLATSTNLGGVPGLPCGSCGSSVHVVAIVRYSDKGRSTERFGRCAACLALDLEATTGWKWLNQYASWNAMTSAVARERVSRRRDRRSNE